MKKYNCFMYLSILRLLHFKVVEKNIQTIVVHSITLYLFVSVDLNHSTYL